MLLACCCFSQHRHPCLELGGDPFVRCSESIVVRLLILWLGEVSTYGETVSLPGEVVSLVSVWLVSEQLVCHLLLLLGELLIGLARIEEDRKVRLGQLLQVLWLKQRRVTDGSDNDGLLVSKVKSVSSTEAVSDSGELGRAFRLGICNGLVEAGPGLFRAMGREPFHEIELARFHLLDWDRVVIQVVRSICEKSLLGVAIRKKLVVLQVDAEDVGQKEECLVLGIVSLWLGDVDSCSLYVDDLALRSSFVDGSADAVLAE